MREARIAAPVPVPWGELSIATGRDDRCAHCRPPFGVRVENEGRPAGLRSGARDEVGDRDGIVIHHGLLLRRERCRRPSVDAAVNSDSETTLADPRQYLDIDRQWRAADLLEPEAMLLHEVEREPIGARKSWCGHL